MPGLFHNCDDLIKRHAVAAIGGAGITSTGECPSDIATFQRAGWQIAHPTWDTFMIKPLLPELTVDDARRLFGVGTDRFLISWLDTT